MTRVRMLAASARPIFDVLIDSLRASGRLSRLRSSLPDDDEDEPDQSCLEVKDDGSRGEGRTIEILHPDEVAAAVLLGQAFECSRDVLAKLSQPDAIVFIEVPQPDFVEPITKVLRKHLLGTETTVVDGDGLSKRTNAAAPSTVVIFENSEEAKPGKAPAGGAELAAAVQLRCAIIGLASDPRLLPRELVSLAEHRIVVRPFDGLSIGAVIKAVTGRHPSTQIEEELARQVTFEVLAIAVRSDLGAEKSLERLRRLIDTRSQIEGGPLLSEMHGLGAAQQWGMELAADLRAYIGGQLPWSACPKGLLISGPPGTGKTSFARALYREIRESGNGTPIPLHFIATSYSAWQSHKDGHLGNVTAAIRKLFAEANRPCIIYIDEIDSLPARGRGGHDDPWWTAVLNCVLEQLDGYERREGVVVIASCNDPTRLDSALVRAGRLDHHIAIPLPDVPSLMGIFRTHLGTDLQGADLRAPALAARGHTGADIERWVRMARRTARTAARSLTLQDLIDAVRGGKPEWPADVRRRIAHHEAGHAIAILALGIAEPMALSIGGIGGVAESELGESQAETRAALEKFLVALLAGRAAEEITFDEVTAGSSNDLARCTRLATRLETSFGFGSLGLVSLSGELSDQDLLAFDRLRAAVGTTIDRAYATALDILGRNRSALDALASALFSAGYLDQAEIRAVLAQTPLRPQDVTDATAAASDQTGWPDARSN
jgi:cell division protease FtsH